MASSHVCGPDLESEPYFQPGVSILKIVKDALRRNGNGVAMIEGDTGEKISYPQVLEQSCRIAAGLQQSGVSARDIVVFCCEKTILASNLLLGTIFTGATAVLIPQPFADVIDKLTSGQVVKALFYDSAVEKSVSQSVSRMSPTPPLVAKIDMREPTITSLLRSAQEFQEYNVQDIKKHVPFVLFSSGTTGYPKGVEVSDIGAQLAGILLRFTPESVLLQTPFYWYSALCFLMGSIIRNYPLTFTNSKDVKHILKIVDEHKIESFFCNMGGLIQYRNESSFENLSLSSVKNVFFGGETILPSVARPVFTKMLKGKASFVMLYGNTEAGVLTDIKVLDKNLELGLCGKPCAGVEIKIQDDHGGLVKRGVTGTVMVKTQASKGYWCRDDLNQSFFDSEGFYNTGDFGYINDEGSLYVLGRICNLINFRGTKISQAVLENLLMDHPAVHDAVVVDTPDSSDGQHPTAFVVVKKEYLGIISENSIRTHIDERVEDSMKLRGGVHFRVNIPRGFTGKAIRKFL